MERWMLARGFPSYEVSDLGRVRRREAGRGARAWLVLTPQLRPDRRLNVCLRLDGRVYSRRIHLLVMEAFHGERPLGMEVNHRDGDPGNNCLSNLEWTTPAANKRHAVAMGLIRGGERHGLARLSDADVEEVRRRCAAGELQRVVGADFGISQGQVTNLVRRRRRTKVITQREVA